ncbi:MAG TPA: CPBP family intramembrane metalloprotease [Chloroflexi bacterium]|nr:CPBP family intramembrane metalloprotease [Chloroflexota bacterium]
MMGAKVDTRRVLIFLAFAFGIAWATGLVVYLTGGSENSPELIPGTPITLALVLVAVFYMWAPAVAHILTRLITREGWQNTYLKPRFRQGWPYWLAAWFLPAALTIAGGALFFALFPRYFDSSLRFIRELLAQAEEQAGQPLPITPAMFAAIQTLQAVLFAPLINSLFTFGEEFGWRAYLQPKLMPLGGRRAVLLMGLIWGVWHWPVILMGHNYGLDYPGAPYLGLLMTLWVMTLFAAFLGWVALRGGSVWPAVIGHAALNGIAGLGQLFTRGEPNPLLGPLPVGLIGSAGFAVLALWIFLRPGALSERDPASGEEEPDTLPATPA